MTSDYPFGTFELFLTDGQRRTEYHDNNSHQSTGESTTFRPIITPDKYTTIVLLSKGRNT